MPRLNKTVHRRLKPSISSIIFKKDDDEKKKKSKHKSSKKSQVLNTFASNSQVHGMSHEEFRRNGKEMVDFIADYLSNISERRVTSEVALGYLRPMLPNTAPEKGESWNDIVKDIERVILPGITHWQHPRFHGYFPAGNDYASILAEMLSAGLGIVGFSWASCPACTELEPIMLDWLGRMMSLPLGFIHPDSVMSNETKASKFKCDGQSIGGGGGALLGSASECVFVAMLTARSKTMKCKLLENPSLDDGQILSRLVCYTSKLAHSCVEKASSMTMVKIRQLPVDEHYSLRGETLENSIKSDREKGLIPFFVCATFGTTSCCSLDNFDEIGQICQREKLWFHVDGAYAGSALICEEFRYLMKGFEYVDSFNVNPNKWLLMNFDCSCFWVRDKDAVMSAMTVDPLYLQHEHSAQAIDLRHWGVALSRRFRSLKILFTVRSHGAEGLRRHIREHCRLAKIFARLISEDSSFEIIGDVVFGLVCFRLKGDNKLTENLLLRLEKSGQIHVVRSMVNDKLIIRFAVCAKDATEYDMNIAFQIIQTNANGVLHDVDQLSKKLN